MMSWEVKLGFRNTRGRGRFVFCDLNNRERPIKRHPVQRAMLSSYFMDPFPVWAATLEEIVGEKLFAIADQEEIRVKDIYDIKHVLEKVPEVPIDATGTRRIYDDLRDKHRYNNRYKHASFDSLPETIDAVAKHPLAEMEWGRAVGNLTPKPPELAACAEAMIELVRDRLLI